jgi:dTDP-4-amino-4,6-dideoxygalactose transaminase
MSDPNYIVFGKPFIGEVEIAEVVDTCEAAGLAPGPKTTRFEKAFRSYIGDHLTDSLHGLGIGCGVHYLSVSEHPAWMGS